MRRSSPAHLFAPLLTGCLFMGMGSPSGLAQCATAVLSTPDGAEFGDSVAADGQLALVGDPSGQSAGVAWLLERGPWTWSSVADFHPKAGTAGNARYGAAVALSGDLAAVGAPGEAGAAGAVYVYRREGLGWVQQVRLMAPDASPGAEFGAALALDGDRLAVGSPHDDQAAPGAGAVYVYVSGPTGWELGDKLLGTSVLPGDGMGASVALEGGLLAAGTQGSGWVWLFEEQSEGFEFTAVVGLDGTGALGRSLALDGGRLLAGSPTTHATGIQSGAAHLFERTGGAWNLTATFAPPEPLIFAQYGASVRLDGAVAVIGVPSAEGGEGVVHAYARQDGAWALGATYSALAGPEYIGLGRTLGLSGDVIVAGATASFGPPGVVYVLGGFRPWDSLGGGVAGSTGSPSLSAHGTLCGGSSVTLAVAEGKPSSAVMYIVGFSAVEQPFHEGTLWPAPDLLRFGVLDAGGNGTLSGTWPIAQPGMQAVYAQAWVSDATAAAGLAGSNGLRVVTP
ncbi:MAG: FG-GAP repeat protein [Planctomycetota bacterium]